MKKTIFAAAIATVAFTGAANAFTADQTQRFQSNYSDRFGVELSTGQANGLLNVYAQIRENNDNARGVIGKSRVVAEFESYGSVVLGNYDATGRGHVGYWSHVRNTVGVNTAEVFGAKFENARAGLAVDAFSAEGVERQNRFEDSAWVARSDRTRAGKNKFNRVTRAATAHQNGARANAWGLGANVRFTFDRQTGPLNWQVVASVANIEERDAAIALSNEYTAIAEAQAAAEAAAAAARTRLAREIIVDALYIGEGEMAELTAVIAENGFTIEELNAEAAAWGHRYSTFVIIGFSATGTVVDQVSYRR